MTEKNKNVETVSESYDDTEIKHTGKNFAVGKGDRTRNQVHRIQTT